ncbi:LPXTG cell wall anchor domain-containing protein [Kitasatospora sp. NBC_01246]|uniref:SCO1860 family LAETG-anchored protein n=1 Tax=Kitasatospora sp. NBC_01246 TaxID=2903570 RepID=UPI002E344E75|nr:SCO1860 family LAETG-anchored protein [Kitasatospora sp. NBC_01246]
MSSSRSTSFAGSAVGAAVASALVVAPVLLVAPVAHATGPTPAPATAAAGSTSAAAAPTVTAGRARAVTAELALDVQLLSKVDVPVNLALNKVESPAQREGSLLTAKVDGVDQQGPVTLVKADVGTSVVKSDAKGTAASVKLVNADVHAPGLPATTLLGLEALSSSVTCPVDGPPTADVTAPAKLTVLGKPVTLSLYGPTDVDVPLVGRVSVEFSKRATTSTTAAASALEVQIEVNPLNLNVAKVTGKITVASVSCEKPTAPVTPTPSVTPTAPGTAPAVQPAVDATSTAPGRTARPQATATAAGGNLAATGGSDATGPLAAGAAALVAVGGGALWVTRRRAAHARKH